MIKLQFLFAIVVMLFSACGTEHRKAFAIEDFRQSLRPFLNEIVTKGIVTYHDESKLKSITDAELLMLSEAENPILRATAIIERLNRNPKNTVDILRPHLDDTALVPTDHGEFGMHFEKVADFVIGKSGWPTAQSRDSTVDLVLKNHNGLSSAYNILRTLEPQQQYYQLIREMAERPRQPDPDGGFERSFDEIEYALFGLAKFKKQEDVQLIKRRLAAHVWELSVLSFRLMAEFPDTAYLDVLQRYHRVKFYKFSGNRPNGFTGYNSDKAAPEDLIKALVIQKNERSARLLDTMLARLETYECFPYKEEVLSAAIREIWENPCPAYAGLRARLRKKAEALGIPRLVTNAYKFDLPPEMIVDTTIREYGWHY